MIKKELERQCRERFDVCSDENIHWIMCSLYMQFPASGPYTSLNGYHGSRSVCEGHLKRKLYKKLFFGAYGPAGIVYTIDGSPPRGAVYVTEFKTYFDGLINRKNFTIHKGKGIEYRFRNALGEYFIRCFEIEEREWRKNNALPNESYKKEHAFPIE